MMWVKFGLKCFPQNKVVIHVFKVKKTQLSRNPLQVIIILLTTKPNNYIATTVSSNPSRTQWNFDNSGLCSFQYGLVYNKFSQTTADAKLEVIRQHSHRHRRPQWPLLWSKGQPEVRCAHGWSGQFQSLQRGPPPSLHPEDRQAISLFMHFQLSLKTVLNFSRFNEECERIYI